MTFKEYFMNETMTAGGESKRVDEGSATNTAPTTARGRVLRTAAQLAVSGPWRGMTERLMFAIGHRFPTNAAVLSLCRHFGLALMKREGAGFDRVAVFESGGKMHWGGEGLAAPLCAIFYFVGTIAAQGGEDERFITKLLPRALKDGDVFFDIGANVGFYSCFAGPLCGKSGAIHAFEANPYLIPHLRRSAELNRRSANIVINDVALGKEANQTLQLFDPEWIGSSSLFKQTWLNTSSSVTVPVTTVDEYRRANKITRLDVVKLDIEGGELDALRGMQETFDVCPPPLIICELASLVASSNESKESSEPGSPSIYPLQIIDFLAQKGYEARYISESDGCLAGRVERTAVERMTQKAINVAFVRPSLKNAKPHLFCQP
jgi:FkbM family methyltransferase